MNILLDLILVLAYLVMKDIAFHLYNKDVFLDLHKYTYRWLEFLFLIFCITIIKEHTYTDFGYTLILAISTKLIYDIIQIKLK